MSTCRNLLLMYYVLAVSSPLTKTLANTIYIYGAYPGAVGMLQKHIYIYGAYPGAVGAQKPIYIYIYIYGAYPGAVTRNASFHIVSLIFHRLWVVSGGGYEESVNKKNPWGLSSIHWYSFTCTIEDSLFIFHFSWSNYLVVNFLLRLCFFTIDYLLFTMYNCTRCEHHGNDKWNSSFGAGPGAVAQTCTECNF